MASKTLCVLGDANAGKKTLTWHLVFTCGASLPEIAPIEKSRICDYRGIATLYRQKGRPVSFYGPSAQYTITGDHDYPPHLEQTNHSTEDIPGIADIALWAVDASADDYGARSSQSLASLLSSGKLRVEEQLIIVATKMDLANWSETVFAQVAHSFTKIKLAHFKISIVPVSGLHGDNLVEKSDKAAHLQPAGKIEEGGLAVLGARPLMSLL
ncbi:uncharacterized protein B0I36DRAFT_369989 [Microdochium trichocladiopsis]|uniref:P-loop containing nucleoside triphosphate hydrolase protein n=1 Tax=Microdochium trichocladiopsis TaxID=1682393 RepID=A0A9P8XTT8_9PEZI|nr:uncharacterized protein B0I36DRAFT_369989 [Microdochium trichocladiopsis]KAH7012209.1 hypothetical protein B0I36DRAFT_369989 [Microdochium trichocladiopsis]